MSKLFEEMAQATAEARAYMEGERTGYKVTLPDSIDVRGIRKRLRFSQSRFADTFGLSVDAIRHWESGRRSPEAAARALLLVIAHDPQVVMHALAQAQLAQPTSAKTIRRHGRPALAIPTPATLAPTPAAQCASPRTSPGRQATTPSSAVPAATPSAGS